jgi:hypothetical protein
MQGTKQRVIEQKICMTRKEEEKANTADAKPVSSVHFLTIT